MSANTKEQYEKTKESAKEFGKDAKDLASSASKDAKQNGEEALDKTKKKCSPYVEQVKTHLENLYGFFKAKSTLAYQKTLVGIQGFLVELQNPIVSGHVAFYSSLIASALNGYAHYHSRYLKGKSDKEILTIATGATAFLAADSLFIKKFYKKFDKK
ncbi:hypothetical protein ACO0OE_003934 [Hanseniaspora uvarum]